MKRVTIRLFLAVLLLNLYQVALYGEHRRQPSGGYTAIRSVWLLLPAPFERARPYVVSNSLSDYTPLDPALAVRPGMSAEEVLAAAGEPRGKVFFRNKMLWRYDRFNILFEDGKVSRIRRRGE